MQLHSLHHTTCLRVYYDASNDWLFLDWSGELTLPAVQEACLALAACFLTRPYPRVLNSNEQVTSVHWSVAPWLALNFLPHLALAGVEHVAWVHAASLLGQHMMQTILNWLPGPILTAFDDLENATQWLQHLRPAVPAHAGAFVPARSAAIQAQLAAEVTALSQRIAASARLPVG